MALPDRIPAITPRVVGERRFVGLLRRAVELGEMGRLCWIPAEGEAVDLADVRVRIEGGRVAVEGRGEAAAPAPLVLAEVA